MEPSRPAPLQLAMLAADAAKCPSKHHGATVALQTESSIPAGTLQNVHQAMT